jgi:hypothetical protein
MSTEENNKQRVQQEWYALVSAEQQGASIQVLEQLYASYILAVEEYNRCTAPKPIRKQKLLPAYIKYPSNATTDSKKKKKRAS